MPVHRTSALGTPWLWLAVAVGLAALVLTRLSVGPLSVAPPRVWSELISGPDTLSAENLAVWQFRMPRVLTAIAAGLALAMAGAAMQTLFGNPLAGPDVLGISAGASLGVALTLLGGGILAVGWGLTWAAVAGASATMGLVLLIAPRVRPPTLLLLGLMLATSLSGWVGLLQAWGDAERGRAYLLWTMGSIGGTSLATALQLLGWVVPAAVVLMVSARGLDALHLGPLAAEALGVSAVRLRWALIVAVSLVTGAVTAVCGPIAFVGVAVPHVAAALLGHRLHRSWLPLTGLLGAGVLLGCDVLTALLPGGESVPLNALTAVLGAPVVAVVIWRREEAWAN